MMGEPLAGSSRIWLVTDDRARCEHWRTALNVLECRVLDPANLADQRIDVIVADRPLRAEEIAAIPTNEARGNCGLVAVGWRGAADVHLSADSTARELRLACGLLGRIVQSRRTIARQARENQLLRHMALSDPLTGLANRRAWDDEFPRRVAEAEAARRSLCLAIIDLDQLKAVNEARGHVVGDQQLRAVARALSAATSVRDLVARLGGDEFAVVYAEGDAEQAAAMISLLRERLDESLQREGRDSPADAAGEVASPEMESHPTVSIGWVVISPAERRSPDLWFADADRALRAAKRRGRAQSVGFSPDLD